MKKNNLKIYLLLLFEILIIFNSEMIIKNVISTSILFIIHIFPSMFPTMFFSNLLISNNVGLIIPNIIKKVFNKLFNFNDSLTTLYIISMISASPTNAIFINDYLAKKIINKKQAEVLLSTTTFINPLFITGTVGVYVFRNVKIGLLLLILLYISSLIKLFLNRKYFNGQKDQKDNKINNNFIESIKTSTKKSVDASILVFGLIIVFNIIIVLINNYLPITNNFIIKSIIEITSGIIYVKNSNLNMCLKIFLCYWLLNFSGLCIQMQNISLIKEKKISYIKYLIFRII